MAARVPIYEMQEGLFHMADQVLNYNPPDEGGRGTIVLKQISWAAVFSGLFVALAVAVLFLCFGMFVGFRMHPGGGMRAWTVIWYFIGSFVSLYIGAWVASHLAGNPRTGRSHGIVTWGLATVAAFGFLSLVSWGVLTQSLGVVKTAAVAGAEAAPLANRMVPPNEAERAQSEAGQALSQAQQQAPSIAQGIGYNISAVALMLFIGLLIAACGALVGGAKGAPRLIPPRTV